MFENDDEFLDEEVNDIISQIKNQSKNLKQPETVLPDLTKEGMEDFIITNAGKVVNHSLEMVEELKREVMAGSDPKMIESVSELVKATTSAIDALSKLKISENKIKAQKEIAQMNIDSKVKKNDDEGDGTPKLTFTRNDILKLLEKKDDVVVDV